MSIPEQQKKTLDRTEYYSEESMNFLKGPKQEMDTSNMPDFRLPNTAYSSKQNGRVALNNLPSSGGFISNPDKAGFGYRTRVEEGADENLLRGNWTTNTLSKLFFSPENVTSIQNAIKRGVYEKSEGRWRIDDQDVDELQIVMRSLFLQYAKNLECDIPGQIRDLNNLVIDWCVPKILTEVSAYKYYLEDISKMPVPLSHPVTMTSSGTKTLPFRKFM